AGTRDDAALAAAGAARLGDGEEVLLEANLAGAAALHTDRRLRPRLGAAAATGRTRGEARDGERLLAAAGRLLEGDVELVLQILTAARPRPPAALATGPEEVAEQIAEDVLEAGPEVEAAEGARLECGVPEAIVLRTPLRVAQDVVRLTHLLEAILGGLVAGILVGVKFDRQLARGLLQLLVAGRPAHPPPLLR